MPSIQPVDPEVTWPSHEGTLGVVGVAPWATLDFLKALYAQVEAGKDWHYPRVLCDINTKLPSRGRHLELGERDPSPFIAATIAELAAQGATAVVVPCNTAHILYQRWAESAPVAVPSIVVATVSALGARGARRAAVLASVSLYRHGLYQDALAAADIEPLPLLDDEVDLVAAAIESVKVRGRIDALLLDRVERLFSRLAARGADGVILGCTELATLETPALHHLPAVADSNTSLATAALHAIGVRARVGNADANQGTSQA